MGDHFTIDEQGPDGATLSFNVDEIPVMLDYDGTVKIQLRSTSERWELYEAVDAAFGDWYREGKRERAAYDRATPAERAAVLDPEHCINPDCERGRHSGHCDERDEQLREFADIQRKRDKGE